MNFTMYSFLTNYTIENIRYLRKVAVKFVQSFAEKKRTFRVLKKEKMCSFIEKRAIGFHCFFLKQLYY